MKFDKYNIVFKSGGAIQVEAGSMNDAKILAQAQRIKEGKNTEIEYAVRIEDSYGKHWAHRDSDW